MPSLVQFWVLLTSWVVLSGWVLSAFHALNRTGYLISLTLALSLALVWRWIAPAVPKPVRPRGFYPRWRRWRRPAPLIFAGIAGLALFAGLLYRDNNGDSDSYRIPRILHWLDHGQWHWIGTLDIRMNIAGCNFEWLTAPIILFAHADRWSFLINWFSLILMPGLVFALLHGLGVRPRVAWWWMWLLPAGWCFVFQASSDINDSFAAVYALAMVVYALRARRTGRATDALLALLAAAFLTGIKQTNLPLALLWPAALLPCWRILFQRPGLTLATAIWAFFISFAPLALFNVQHVGTWTGIAPNSMWKSATLDSPFWGIIGNTFCLSVQNLMPPVFLQAAQWNDAMGRFVQTPFGSHFKSFEAFGELGHNCSGVNCSNAGLGCGLLLLTMVSVFLAWRLQKKTAGATGSGRPPAPLLLILPWLLALVFMAKVGTYQNARQFAPYYILLFPFLLLLPGHARLIRQRWWQRTALLLLIFTAGLVLVSRERPLIPAITICLRLQAAHPDSKLVNRVATAFNARLQADKFSEFLQANLPPEETVVGYAAFMEAAEPACWQPYGRRKAVRILPTDKVAECRQLGIHYVILESYYLKKTGQTLDNWLAEYQSQLVGDFYNHTGVSPNTAHTYLVKIAGQATTR